MARGSTYELQTQLLIAKRLGYSKPENMKDAEILSHEIGQMLTGLSTYLNKLQKEAAPSTEN